MPKDLNDLDHTIMPEEYMSLYDIHFEKKLKSIGKHEFNKIPSK